jgi:uncharacterized protein YndB with AHSA1/START domain
MAEEYSFVFTRTIQARREEVFRAFTHATLLRDWLSHTAHTDPVQGGHIFLRWNSGHHSAGTYLLLDEPAALEFTWEGWQDLAAGRVRVELAEVDGATTLRLVHSGAGDAADGMARAWEASLENLKSVVETGQDLRQLRKPRLGIHINGNFNPAVAAQLGVPVSEGIMLAGTVENTGARAAGLQKNDVLVELNGVGLDSYASLGRALRGLKAGDRPEVVYYRGVRRITTTLELSSIPQPDLPADAAGLAQWAEAMYRGVNQAMFAQFEGLGEERAGRKLVEGEWSVKELVCHFILMERDYQSWAADMLNDTPVKDYLEMRPNVTPRIDALLERFGTLAALCRELELAEAETLAMIRAFPPAFAAERKHLFRRAAQWILETVPEHYFDEHLEQFTSAIG